MFLIQNQISKRVAVNAAALLCAVGLSGQSVFAGGGCAATELSKVIALDATSGDELGLSVEISGDVAIVGARLNDEAGIDAGAAYIYRFDGTTWSQESKLIANDVVAGDHFGVAVDIDGDVAVVGSARSPWTFGSAYVFRFDGNVWNQEGIVEANVPSNPDHFGEAVAIQGDIIAVGAPRDSDPAAQTGAVYVFRYDGKGWNYEWKNFADDAQSGDRMGTSVNISADAIIAGALGDDDQGSASGSAYVFQYNGAAWLHYAKLLASNGATGAGFGSDVDISGDFAIVGANTADTAAGVDAGCAYIFERDQNNQQIWTEVAFLTASDAAASDRFGISVSISGNMGVVGAFRTDQAGFDAGSAYLYERDANGPNTWGEVALLRAADAAQGDWYGWSVAIDGNMGLVGSYRDDDNGASSGSAYTFSGLGDCNENGNVDICDILQGSSDDLNGNGTPDECESAPCNADLDGDGSVNTSDLLELFANWGPNPGNPADLDGDGVVNTSDLLELFANWGPCS